MLQTPLKLTLEEFLALPSDDHNYELVNGQAIPKDQPMSPKRFHARLQPIMWQILENWASAENSPKPGAAYTEWAVVLKRNSEDWVPIPDVTYVSADQLPSDTTDEPCLVTPELVIEIISPSQSFGSLVEKATDYLQAGIPRVWIIDPQARNITVFYPDRPPQSFTGEHPLTDPLLPGLKVIPETVFQQARIH